MPGVIDVDGQVTQWATWHGSRLRRATNTISSDTVNILTEPAFKMPLETVLRSSLMLLPDLRFAAAYHWHKDRYREFYGRVVIVQNNPMSWRPARIRSFQPRAARPCQP